MLLAVLIASTSGSHTMKKLMIIGAAKMLSSPGLAQSTTQKTGINSAICTAPTTQDFIQEAGTSDMFEIESK